MIPAEHSHSRRSINAVRHEDLVAVVRRLFHSAWMARLHSKGESLRNRCWPRFHELLRSVLASSTRHDLRSHRVAPGTLREKCARAQRALTLTGQWLPGGAGKAQTGSADGQWSCARACSEATPRATLSHPRGCVKQSGCRERRGRARRPPPRAHRHAGVLPRKKSRRSH